jgi:hypothetical protein
MPKVVAPHALHRNRPSPPPFTETNNHDLNPHSDERIDALEENSVRYHFIREAVDVDELTMGHVNTEENSTGVATKPLPNSEKRDKICRKSLCTHSNGITI